MNEKYVKTIIEMLCQAYNYKIVEIQHKEFLISPWGAIKNTGNTENVLVFTREINALEDICFNVENEMRNSYINKDIRVIPIAITDEPIDNSYNISPLNRCGIILDYKNNRVILRNEQYIQIAEELQSILNWRASNSKSNRKMAVTYGIIAVNVFVYLLSAILSGNLFNIDINVLINLGAKENNLIMQGEYYRLITCMFLHGGLLHIALNMYSLYNIGPLVEQVYGKVKYLIVYFAAGITSSIFSFLFSNDVSIGASGAIFGLLGITLVFAVSEKEKIGKEFYKNILMVIVANLILGFSIPNIDNFAHLGGLIGGTIVGIVYRTVNAKKHQ